MMERLLFKYAQSIVKLVLSNKYAKKCFEIYRQMSKDVL